MPSLEYVKRKRAKGALDKHGAQGVKFPRFQIEHVVCAERKFAILRLSRRGPQYSKLWVASMEESGEVCVQLLIVGGTF